MIAPSSPADSSAIKGHVIRVTGTIVDVQFPQESAPQILHELNIIVPQEHSSTSTNISI